MQRLACWSVAAAASIVYTVAGSIQAADIGSFVGLTRLALISAELTLLLPTARNATGRQQQCGQQRCCVGAGGCWAVSSGAECGWQLASGRWGGACFEGAVTGWGAAAGSAAVHAAQQRSAAQDQHPKLTRGWSLQRALGAEQQRGWQQQQRAKVATAVRGGSSSRHGQPSWR